MEPLKVGLLGLGRGANQVARALLTTSWCRLVAVASTKPRRLEAFAAAHPEVSRYDDYRSLIVGRELDALFVGLPPFIRGPYLALAAHRQLPVWMLPPPARRFDEALALAKHFEAAECPLVISRMWGFEQGLRPEFLGLEQLDGLFFCRGEAMTCWGEDLDWRGDGVRAGGGAFLDRGYILLDSVAQALGIPATVFMAAGRTPRKNRRHRSDTEDTAAVICQFNNGALASLLTSWTAGPESWRFDLHGSKGTVRVDPLRVAVADAAGRTLREQARPAEPLLPQVEDFLSTLCTNPRGLRSTLRQHLETMAILQAAYLSSQTGQPESPAKILQMHAL